MKSLKKRVITTALAGAMALSMAVPAFASGNTTKVTATYSDIPIDVTVPTAATVQINPMGMPVKLPANDGDTAKEVATQIVTMPSAIINRSSMDLAVGATVTGTIKGNFKFATAAWDPADTNTPLPTANQAFVILEMTKATADVLDDEKKAVDATKIGTEWEKWAEQDFAGEFVAAADIAEAVAGTEDANDCVVVLAAKAVTSTQGMVKLDAATANTDGDLEPQTGSVGFFRLSGQVVEAPKTPWAKTDGFGATIAFTFKASKPADASTGG